MKTFFLNKIKNSITIIPIVLLIISVLFSSCSKDAEPYANSDVIASALSVINASPDSPILQFVLDKQPVHQFSYPDQKIPYFAAFSGARLARIYEAEKLDNPLYEFELKLLQGNYYSLFIGGRKSDLKSFLLRDDLSAPSRGKAKIRFIHLSVDAPALDFEVSTDSVLASNKKFGDYTSFQEIKPGNYTGVIKSHEGASINFPIDLKIEDGKIYTFWTRGLIETTSEEEEFGYSVIQHLKEK